MNAMSSTTTAMPTKRRSHRKMWVTFFIVILIAALIAARLYLPYWVKDYVNRTLDQIPGYKGRVEAIDIHLWRGAYSIRNVKLEKVSGKIPVPFFSAALVDLSIQWKALLHGSLVGAIELNSPKINFVNSEEKEKAQTGIHPSWQKAVKDLFPLKINHFNGKNGEVHFRDFDSDPKVDIFIDHLVFNAENLTNSEKVSKTLMATLDAQGLAESQAPLKIHVNLNPLQEVPAFKLDASLEKLDLKKLNAFFRAYAYFDVQGGEFELYANLNTDGNSFGGYLKPFLKDIKIFSITKDSDNPLRLVWEAVVGVAAEIVENHSEGQIAAKIPLSGKFKDPHPDIWSAIGSLLSNAFIQALIPGLDHGKVAVKTEDEPVKEKLKKTS